MGVTVTTPSLQEKAFSFLLTPMRQLPIHNWGKYRVEGKPPVSAIRDLRISRKFGYAFGLVCVLCALLGSAALFGLLKVNSAVNSIVGSSMPSMKVLGDIRYSVATIRRSDALLLLCDTSACTVRLTAKRRSYITAYNRAIEEYAPMVSYAGERELFETIRGNAATYIASSDRGRQMVEAGKIEDASHLLLGGDAVKAYNAVADAVEADVVLNDTMYAEEGARTARLGHTLLLAICGLMAITVVLCGVIGTGLTRLIVPPLEWATAALEQLAGKDLTAHVEVRGRDELGRLSVALNTSVESMRDVLRTLTRGADTLSAAAEELSVRSKQTSVNTQAQTSKINQIAAAAQEMTATIAEISHNTETAAGASRESAEMAHRGGAVMRAATATMKQIATASSTVAEKMDSLARRAVEIGKVVHVIHEISGQTNLLALNAAIEAAGAGEHGRGFAVVAGEVRRLAERTKGATEEIGGAIRSIQEETRQTLDLMSQSRGAVETGLGETASAHSSLEAIIESSKQVEGQIHLIATAATEQTAASGEISESVSQISNLSGENARAAEEAAEASKSLSELANDLDGIIRQFRIDDETQPGSKLQSAPPARALAPTPHRAY
jgi:methyl-accepting chemotaxis protein